MPPRKSQIVKRTHELPFPIGGIHKGEPNPKQPPFTTPDCLNVRPKDVNERRDRGGIRPGFIKAFQEQIGGLGTDLPIRMLSQVSFVVQDGFNFFVDPWFDEFNTGLFSPVWTEASWLGVKPTIENGTITASEGAADATSGLVRALLDFDTTQDYEVLIKILPSGISHHGTYQIFVRMDSNNPVVTTDGILIELIMTDSRGGWSGNITDYVAGSPTVYAMVDGSLAAFPVLEWGTNGSGDGQFKSPRGIIINPFTEEVFVADTENHRVQVFDKDGTFIAKFGTNGSGNGQFTLTSDIAFSPSGDIYVTDKSNDRIQRFNSSFVFQSKWGTAGTGDAQFNDTWGVAVMSDGKIVVVDGNNHRVQIFTSAEIFDSEFGSNGSGDGQFGNPRGVAVDSNDNIYVCDSTNDRISVHDSSGTFIYAFGATGIGDGQLDSPQYIDFLNDEFAYVTDTGNDRISRWVRKAVFSLSIDLVQGAGRAIAGFDSNDRFIIDGNGQNPDGNNETKILWQYNSDGTKRLERAKIGTGDGQLSSSSLLSGDYDSTGKLYVSDTANNRIVVFGSDTIDFDSNIAFVFNDFRNFAIDSSDKIWMGTQASLGDDYKLQAYNTSGVLQFTAVPHLD